MNFDSKTIVALSTPPGEGAIGIIRLSGKGSIDVVGKCIKQDLSKVLPNTAKFAKFYHKDSLLDEVVVATFIGPKSYTGEDVVEISFHGSSYILQKALGILVGNGAKLAEPGEFTQRAFLNGKMDLSQAEAVADLINSESEAEHRLAMHQMRGGFSKEISALRQQLIDFASLVELELDFAEEDVEFADRSALTTLVEKTLTIIKSLIDSFKVGNAIKLGIPVAIVGKPNAGKSTLLNSLVKEERAIVSDIAGTTRDSIEDIMVINGIKYRFIDTAGLRETQDAIEAIGVERSHRKIEQASIVLYLFDSREQPSEVVEHLESLHEHYDLSVQNIVPIANKTDLKRFEKEELHLQNEVLPVVNLSAKDEIGLDQLIELLQRGLPNKSGGTQQTVVTNTRHLNALKQTEVALNQALNGINQGVSGDLVASDIREALHQLGSITGEISTDDLLGNIFGKFCIGK